ncbi:MAG TPA: hypothetical protein VGL39_24855 [Jatrophihabitantaceae bacterium]|jgi:hypothetical protein
MFHDHSIAGSWPALVARLDDTNALGRWAERDARLAGLGEVERDLVPLLARGADHVRGNEVLAALVRQAADDGGDDLDALLLVLHLCSDWVLPLAKRLRDLSPGMVGVIVCELTCKIRSYRWRTPGSAVAATLCRNTRRDVLAQFRPALRRRGAVSERLLPPDSAEWESALRSGMSRPSAGEDVEVVDLLLWAERAGVERDDLQLLVRTETVRADSAITGADKVVAAEFGLSQRTFYRRRDKTLTALRVVAREYLAAVA